MKKISMIIMVLVVALVSCKKTPEVNLKYVDVERDLMTVGMTTANIQCDYDYIATLKKAYLFYGEGTDESDFTSAEMRVVQNTLYVELMGLKENTSYGYYYEFHNGFNFMRTTLKSFKTEASPSGVSLPTVITAEVTEITANSAKSGGEVTNDGGAEVIERGICWSTNANPTLDDNHIAVGTGIGAFTAMISGLEANTIYCVRAYAINEVGTAYGLDKKFETIGDAPIGAINGLFTINANGDQVYFSQGNLQYQASSNTWRFAENQWNYVGTQIPHWYSGIYGGNVEGSDNHDISETYSGWIDLFSWGTSGYNHGANLYQPWDTNSESIFDYWPYGCDVCNLFDWSGQADWGYNAISNGGNVENKWRTLTQEEWDYVINVRNTSSGMRFAKAIVNDVNGILLFPDQWDNMTLDIDSINYTSAHYDNNVITLMDWENTMQFEGAVFLPAAGHRNHGDNSVAGASSAGNYWSSTIETMTKACFIDFRYGSLSTMGTFGEFWFGYSVRLVQDANL